MGHCGNVPSQRSGDQILSLRRQVRRGDLTRWHPVAPFILDADGQLGEMKGRGNDKPAARYHPYILALLRHDMIRGIKGGGYMPENNFSMSDFDPQTREQLIAKKPELKGLLGYYEEEGPGHRRGVAHLEVSKSLLIQVQRVQQHAVQRCARAAGDDERRGASSNR